MSVKKINSLVLGLMLGLIVPVLSSYILYYFTLYPLEVKDAITRMQARNIHVHVLSLVVIPNILLFFLFTWSNRLKSSRGVLMATIVYAIAVFMMKMM